MAKIAEFCKVAGPVAIALYNEDGSIHTHFAPTRHQAMVLAKSLGAVDIQEVAACKLFPNSSSGTSKSGRSSGSRRGRSGNGGSGRGGGASAT